MSSADPSPELEEIGLVTRSQYNLMDEIEKKLLTGKLKNEIRDWANEKFNVDPDECDKLIDLIRASWAIDREPGRMAGRKDELRAKYHYVYRMAMEKDQYFAALKALDSLAKMDGLTLPDINISIAANADITSRTRERAQQLFQKMQGLTGQPIGVPDGRVIDVPSGPGSSGKKPNGENK